MFLPGLLPDNDSVHVLFQERQSFRQAWLWLILALAALPVIVLIAAAGDWIAMTITVVLEIAFLGAFWLAHLDVAVTDSDLVFRFVPFHRKPRRIAGSEIAEAAKRVYDPLTEYGGWGIRWSGNGWAYNVSGDEGVQLVLRSGKRILIGSQRSAELEAAIRQVSGKDSGVSVTP